MARAAHFVTAFSFLTIAACGSGQSGSSPDDGGGQDGAGGGSSGASSGGTSSGSSGASSGTSSGTSSGASSGASSGSSGTSSGASGSSGGDAGAASTYSVLQHHKNPTRNGVFTEPTFTKTAVATMHKTTFMGTLSTQVYAQPLYVENGPGGPVFVVATEQNHLTVLNASTGAVVWDDAPSLIGQPVTGGLPCGNISTLGITGTPYIDFSSGQGVIYFDAMTTPDNNTTAKHLVYAVKLSDGTVLPNWPVDMNAKVTGFSSRIQSERGALQFLNGTLYVPYGGFYGDCGTYYGWVVAIPTSNPQSPTSWHTTASKGGIWASGSLPTDGTSLFPVTGNTSGATTWGEGEAVLRIGAGATFTNAAANYFAPTNWATLDIGDKDLGGASAVLFDMPGAAHPHLVAQGGKDGNLYILDRDALGGIGGQLVSKGVSTGEINGAPAVYTTSMGTYVALHTSGGGVGCPNGGTGNVVVAKVAAGPPVAVTVAWCTTKSGLGSPMVTTTDGSANAVVWDANNALWGFDGDTGALLAGGTTGTTNTAMSTSIQGFNTAISANGKIVAGVNGALYVFTP